jgi:hypothetical protein
MLRAFATWFAKWKYVWNKETESGMHLWSARVAEQNAKASRDLIVKLKNEADAYEARIKSVAEMEENGFWQCANGHEEPVNAPENSVLATEMVCYQCLASAKLIKRSEMTGQEKYESDKDRKDAEKLLAARREEIANKETEAGQQDATAKYFRQQAESGRRLADSLRKL